MSSLRSPSYRILHIDTEKTWRGGQQQVFSLVKGLHQRGHHNFIAARPGSPLAERFQSVGIPLWGVNPWSELALGSGFFLSARVLDQKIDIVHAHSAHGVMLARLATRGTTVPYVLTRRVDFPLRNNYLTRWKYAGASKVLAISRAVRDVLITSGIPAEKIELVPSGVDFSRYEGVTPVDRAQWNIPADALVVGQVAALAPHKDQITFLEALKIAIQKNPRVMGVIVGEGPLESVLKGHAEKLGLGAHVYFAGYLKKPLDALKAFDVFCLSSKEEGLGTSIIDAMALKVPVVATSAGGIPELVEDGVTGYLAPAKNPAALAEKMLFALSDTSSREKILPTAQQKADEYDVNSTVLRTELVYRALLPHKLI